MTLGGCTSEPAEVAVGPGTVLAGRGPALEELLAQLVSLDGTPLARWAGVLGERVAGCDAFFAHWPEELSSEDAEDWPQRVACLDEGAPSGDLTGPASRAFGLLDRAQAGAAGWLWSHRSASGSWLVEGRRAATGGHHISARLPVNRGGEASEVPPGAWDLLLPAAEAAGPSRLAEGSLVHLRVRPDAGLDLATRVEADGLADRLFSLRNDLFLAATLAGTWELAVYLPREGQRIPPLALRLDAKNADRAVTAMESFVTEVRQTWRVNRRPVTLAGRRGACLDDLNVMPDLAPCYVLDDADASSPGLVVGWNAGSIELALGPDARDGNGDGESSVARIHLDQLPEADALLARSSGAVSGDGGPGLPAAVVYPWRLLAVEGRREGPEYRFEARLEPAG